MTEYKQDMIGASVVGCLIGALLGTIIGIAIYKHGRDTPPPWPSVSLPKGDYLCVYGPDTETGGGACIMFHDVTAYCAGSEDSERPDHWVFTNEAGEQARWHGGTVYSFTENEGMTREIYGVPPLPREETTTND